MKKLSVLIAMILCVTIGGVYAAWTYTNPSADITDEKLEQLITISTATEEGAAGVYNVETNVTAMSIEQAGAEGVAAGEDFHLAKLQYTTADGQAPYIKFTLKLAENTGSDIFDTLKTTYTITVEDVATQYGGQDIFVDLKAGNTEIVWEYDDAEDVYYYEVLLENEIAINQFILASKPEHTAFVAALGRPVLEVHVSDGTTPQA